MSRVRNLMSLWKTVCAIFLLSVATAIVASAQILTTLASFDGSNGDGPSALIQATDGNFYGTTNEGGAHGYGTVFQVTSSGTLTTLYSFNGGDDGSYPDAPLVQATDGNFYGTTAWAWTDTIFGTIFKITPDGTLTTIHILEGGTDGNYPEGTLVQATDGDFYGTTTEGGRGGLRGMVFQITPDGTLTMLHSFEGGDGGEFPLGGLVQARDGNFYGATFGDLRHNEGSTLFQITPGGTLTTLHTFDSFDCTEYGAGPSGGLVQGTDGDLYGTTMECGAYGGGTFFKITLEGELTTLYSFCESGSRCWDGRGPHGGLVLAKDGNFYGTTSGGGATDAGTVFGITPRGTLIMAHSFFCTDYRHCPHGGEPFSGLVQATNGKFYGTTRLSFGTVFSLAHNAASGEQVDYFGGWNADFTVWRPSTGFWFSIDGSGKSMTQQWGMPKDIPQVGDYDGDGKTDVAVWRPSDGTWRVIESSTGTVVSRQWGEPTDVPVPGDYDGDGKTDFAVWRPSDGTWHIILSSTGKVFYRQWGMPTDVPGPGDFDGDGKTDFAVWRPSDGTWRIMQSSSGKVLDRQWGMPTDVPVPRDYDGDGKIDFAVWRPSDGTWRIMQSSTGKVVAQQWGMPTDVPVARDYDGDGKADFAVWRPSSGTWHIIRSTTGKAYTQQWGASTDVPMNKALGQ